MKKNYINIPVRLLFVILPVFFFTAYTNAMVYTFDLAMTGQSEVPPNGSGATGIVIGNYDNVSKVLSFMVMFNGLTAPATAAHFHGPATPSTNGPVQITLTGFPTGVTSGSYTNSFVLTPDQESQLLCGLWYINIHTAAFPGGEIRSQVKEGTTTGNISTFQISLAGLNEVPPNGSPATGTFVGTFDNTTNTLGFTIMFNGLLGPSTAAHIHGPAFPGTNGPVLIPLAGFPVGVTSGTYISSFVLTPTQVTYLNAGQLYVNIHTQVYPGGEIRCQLKEGTLTGNCGTTIPTLSQWGLIILGFVILVTGSIFIFKRMA